MPVTPFWKTPTFRLDLLAVALLFGLSFAFFSPLVGGKKVLPQSDVIQAKGMQKNVDDYRARTGQEPYWSESMFGGMPAITISIQYAGNVLVKTWRVLNLGLPYPIGLLFWGMLFSFLLLRVCGVQPLLAASGGVAYGFFTFHLAWIEAGHTNKIHALMLAPGVLWALVWGYRAPSWVRGFTAAAVLLLVLGVHLYFNHLQMTYYLLLVAVAVVIAEAVRAIRGGALKPYLRQTALFGGVAVLALLLNAAPIYPLYHYSQYTIRGPSELQTGSAETRTGGLDRDYAYGWSYGRDEMLTLLVPNAMGGASSGTLAELGKSSETLKQLRSYQVDADATIRQLPSYWGEQAFTSGPIYLGAVVLFAFVLGIILVDGALKWALVYAALLSVLLALGRFSFSVPTALGLLALPVAAAIAIRRLPRVPAPAVGLAVMGGGWLLALALDADPATSYRLSDLLMDYLPLYNKFRVPSSMLVIAALTVPWLGVMGLQAALDTGRDAGERSRAALWAGGIVGGLCLLLWLLGGELLSFSSANDARYQLPPELLRAITEDRQALLSADALRSLLFVLIATGLTWAAATARLSTLAYGALIAALCTADLVGVGRRFITKETFVPKRNYDENFAPGEAETILLRDTSFFRVFPIGRNPFNDGRTPYHLNTVGGYNAAKLRRYQQLIEAHLGRGVPNVVNMLNTKYLITREALQNPAYPLVAKTQDGEFIHQNVQNYGPAWFVQNVITVSTPDAALDTLDGIDTRAVAVVEQADAASLSAISSAPLDTSESVRLVAHDNVLRRYATTAKQSRLAVLSEVYYPEGWTATLDGQPTPIVRVNFVLRGVVVPAGAHTLELRYDDPTVHAAERISGIVSALLGLMLLAAAVLEWRSRRTPPPASA